MMTPPRAGSTASSSTSNEDDREGTATVDSSRAPVAQHTPGQRDLMSHTPLIQRPSGTLATSKTPSTPTVMSIPRSAPISATGPASVMGPPSSMPPPRVPRAPIRQRAISTRRERQGSVVPELDARDEYIRGGTSRAGVPANGAVAGPSRLPLLTPASHTSGSTSTSHRRPFNPLPPSYATRWPLHRSAKRPVISGGDGASRDSAFTIEDEWDAEPGAANNVARGATDVSRQQQIPQPVLDRPDPGGSAGSNPEGPGSGSTSTTAGRGQEASRRLEVELNEQQAVLARIDLRAKQAPAAPSGSSSTSFQTSAASAVGGPSGPPRTVGRPDLPVTPLTSRHHDASGPTSAAGPAAAAGAGISTSRNLQSTPASRPRISTASMDVIFVEDTPPPDSPGSDFEMLDGPPDSVSRMGEPVTLQAPNAKPAEEAQVAEGSTGTGAEAMQLDLRPRSPAPSVQVQLDSAQPVPTPTAAPFSPSTEPDASSGLADAQSSLSVALSVALPSASPTPPDMIIASTPPRPFPSENSGDIESRTMTGTADPRAAPSDSSLQSQDLGRSRISIPSSNEKTERAAGSSDPRAPSASRSSRTGESTSSADTVSGSILSKPPAITPATPSEAIIPHHPKAPEVPDNVDIALSPKGPVRTIAPTAPDIAPGLEAGEGVRGTSSPTRSTNRLDALVERAQNRKFWPYPQPLMDPLTEIDQSSRRRLPRKVNSPVQSVHRPTTLVVNQEQADPVSAPPASTASTVSTVAANSTRRDEPISSRIPVTTIIPSAKPPSSPLSPIPASVDGPSVVAQAAPNPGEDAGVPSLATHAIPENDAAGDWSDIDDDLDDVADADDDMLGGGTTATAGVKTGVQVPVFTDGQALADPVERLTRFGLFCPTMKGRKDNRWTSWSTKIVPGTLQDLMWELDLLYYGERDSRHVMRQYEEDIVWANMRHISDKRRFMFCCWQRFRMEHGPLEIDIAGPYLKGWIEKYGEIMRFGGLDREVLDLFDAFFEGGVLPIDTLMAAHDHWNAHIRHYHKELGYPQAWEALHHSDTDEMVARGLIRLKEFEPGGRDYAEVQERKAARREGREPVLPKKKYVFGDL